MAAPACGAVSLNSNHALVVAVSNHGVKSHLGGPNPRSIRKRPCASTCLQQILCWKQPCPIADGNEIVSSSTIAFPTCPKFYILIYAGQVKLWYHWPTSHIPISTPAKNPGWRVPNGVPTANLHQTAKQLEWEIKEARPSSVARNVASVYNKIGAQPNLQGLVQLCRPSTTWQSQEPLLHLEVTHSHSSAYKL